MKRLLFLFSLFFAFLSSSFGQNFSCYYSSGGSAQSTDTVSYVVRWHITSGTANIVYRTWYDRNVQNASVYGVLKTDGQTETILSSYSLTSWPVKGASASIKEGYVSGTAVIASGTFGFTADFSVLTWTGTVGGISSGTSFVVYQDVYVTGSAVQKTAIFPYKLVGIIGDGKTYHVGLYLNGSLYSSGIALSGTVSSAGSYTVNLPSDYGTSPTYWSATWVLMEGNQPLSDSVAIPKDAGTVWTAPTLNFTLAKTGIPTVTSTTAQTGAGSVTTTTDSDTTWTSSSTGTDGSTVGGKSGSSVGAGGTGSASTTTTTGTGGNSETVTTGVAFSGTSDYSAVNTVTGNLVAAWNTLQNDAKGLQTAFESKLDSIASVKMPSVGEDSTMSFTGSLVGQSFTVDLSWCDSLRLTVRQAFVALLALGFFLKSLRTIREMAS